MTGLDPGAPLSSSWKPADCRWVKVSHVPNWHRCPSQLVCRQVVWYRFGWFVFHVVVYCYVTAVTCQMLLLYLNGPCWIVVSILALKSMGPEHDLLNAELWCMTMQLLRLHFMFLRWILFTVTVSESNIARGFPQQNLFSISITWHFKEMLSHKSKTN